MLRRPLAVLGLGVLASASLLSQTPPRTQAPSFRTSVEYVEVDARVVDGKGNPVHNLTKDDFKILEDGKEQAISTFSAVDIPIEGTATTTTAFTTDKGARVEPDVSANLYRVEESRVFVILLDDRQIDALRTQSTVRIAKEFIERLGPRDLCAIVSSSGRTDSSQALTGNKTLLSNAVDVFVGRKMESAIILQYKEAAVPRSYAAEKAFEMQQSVSALESVVNWMIGMQGRSKVLLLLSEGLDYDAELSMSSNNGDITQLSQRERDVITLAARGNVTIHPIDPRGLYGYDELILIGNSYSAGQAEAGAVASLRESGAGAGPVGSRAPVGLDASSRAAKAFKEEVARAQIQLRSVAAETGGTPVVGSNKFEAALDQIISQHSTYYLLGYQSTNLRQDGRVRKIDVRVNGKGLKVISRRSYREANANAPVAPAPASPDGVAPEAWEALSSPIPMSDLPLRATAAAFRGPDGKASLAVIVESPAEAVEMIERSGKFSGALQVITAAVDRRNKVTTAETSRIDLTLGSARLDLLKRDGFRTVTTLASIPAGTFQVRVAVAPENSSRRGSVWFDVEVPDFSKGTLSMSSLLVGSRDKGPTPTANVAKTFEDAMPVPPTAIRQFSPADELVVFAELYANRSAAADVVVSIRDKSSLALIDRTQAVTADDFASGKGTHRVVARLPLSNLAVGDYLLSVEAKTRGNDPDVVSRAVPLRIVP